MIQNYQKIKVKLSDEKMKKNSMRFPSAKIPTFLPSRQFDKDMTRDMNESASFPAMSSGEVASLNIKMAEKEREKKKKKKQPTAVPLDALPERCTMTMHHEISARGSLMPAGDGSAMLYDTLSPTRQ